MHADRKGERGLVSADVFFMKHEVMEANLSIMFIDSILQFLQLLAWLVMFCWSL